MTRRKIWQHRFNDPNEIDSLAGTLARAFPVPDDVITGIYELLLNALEHGNLGIGYETKGTLLRAGQWHDEVCRRLRMDENAEKYVEVALEHDADACCLTITDMGQGFDWRYRLLKGIDPDSPNGRGLTIAMKSGFDALAFNPCGNAVTCMTKLRR
jgi:anti-sigma regulatory factor (Ser/Thr protein kinase)